MKNNLVFPLFNFLKQRLPLAIKFKLSFLRHDIFNIFSSIGIETSSACNRKCPYCPNSKYDRRLVTGKDKMEPDLFRKVIDELSGLKWVGQIHPDFYNEPLLDQRLEGFIEYARAKLPGCVISIATNGDFLTIERYDKLVRAGVRSFAVSLHQKEELATIAELKKYRQEHGNEGVQLIYNSLEYIGSRGGLIKLDGEAGRPKNCMFPLSLIYINCNGDVIFCCEDYLNTVKLGNIKNERLLDIWNKPYYRKLRNDLRKGVFKEAVCQACRCGKNIYMVE